MQKNLINTILKKGNITGEDVGRLYVANTCYELKTLMLNHKQSTAFSQAEFDTVANKLTDNADIRTLNYYICLMNSVKTCYNTTNANIKNISYYIELFKGIIRQLVGLTWGAIDAKRQPKIMTQKQYNELWEKTIKEYDYYTYYEIVLDACHKYILEYARNKKKYEDNPEENIKPKQDKEVDRLLSKYQSEPIKNKELFKMLQGLYGGQGRDYIRLDGTYIDTVGEFIDELDLRNITVSEDITKGLDLEQEITTDFVKKVLTPEQIDKLIDMDEPDEDEDKIPDYFSKYDLIEDIDELTTAEIDAKTTDKQEQKELLHILDLFLKELPELNELIIKRFNSIDLLKQYTNAGLSDYLKIKISWKDLAEANIFDYAKHPYNIINFEYPQGIAIIKEDTLEDFSWSEYGKVDKKGNFKEPDKHLIDMFEKNTAKLKELAQAITPDINLYKKMGLSLDILLIKASNKYIDLFNEIADVPDLMIFKHSLKETEEQINDYNELLYSLLNYLLVEYGRHGNREEAQELRHTLHKAIPYFNIHNIDIKEENIKKAREAISNKKNIDGNPIYTAPLFILAGNGE